MATQPVGQTAQNYTYTKPRRTQADADFPLGPEQSKNRQTEEPAKDSGPRDRIRALLTEISGGSDKRLTFQDVVDHRDTLETKWNQTVTADLEALGIAVSDRFRLMTDPATGQVVTSSDHPHKNRIDAYFATNAERSDEFNTLLQLGNLADTAQTRLSPDDMQQPLLPDAMALWYRTNMDTATLDSGGGMLLGAGGTTYKRLDIRV